MKTWVFIALFVPGLVLAQTLAAVDDEILFQARCADLCHQLPDPNMLKAKQWVKVLKVMQKRMQQRGVMPMSEQEFSQILAYLQANSRQ